MFLIITPTGTPLYWRAGMDGVDVDTPIVFETVALAKKWLMPGDRVVSTFTTSKPSTRGEPLRAIAA